MALKPMRKQTESDPLTGIIYMSKPDNGNDSAPFAKGFVGVSKEMLRVLLEQEEDDYGSIKIEVAVWKKDNQPGVLSGKAQLPYAIRKQMESGEYVPTVNVKSAPQKKAQAYIEAVNPQTGGVEDVDVDDIPF